MRNSRGMRNMMLRRGKKVSGSGILQVVVSVRHIRED